MILLTGLVGKNAILLVDYTNSLRKRGVARNDALLQAGPTRLRPILMTTFAEGPERNRGLAARIRPLGAN